jgi:transcriptional regulator with XRE-family HTH domain
MDWSVNDFLGQPNKNLIRFMDFHGYTVSTLAEAAGVSQTAVWRIVNGRTYPRLDTILLICNTLNCTIDNLYPMNYNKVELTLTP